MESSAVRKYAADLPDEPGVYQFLTTNGNKENILYIGKALNLSERVQSYADPRSDRIAQMVTEADRIDIAITDTETQALLLEANLIKRHQPRYNVRLKDDKSYPLIQITDHQYPQIQITRDPDESAMVFGPYTNKTTVEFVVKAIRDVYGIRGCSDHKFRNRDRPCLDHDLGLCTAPCTEEITTDTYLTNVAAVTDFLRGDTQRLLDPLTSAMEQAANEKAYERAANIRDKIQAVKALHGMESAAVSGDEESTQVMDILGISRKQTSAMIARLHSENGQLVERSRHSVAIPKSNQSINEILSAFIPQFYAERSVPDIVLIPDEPTDDNLLAWIQEQDGQIRTPQDDRESTLLELATKNANRWVDQPNELQALSQAIGVDEITRIEGFDISHSHGKDVVGGNVVFTNGSPEKKGYRRRKLPAENDDYANMKKLIRWRANRSQEGRDTRPDPDLLLIDGGKGQLTAAQTALEATDWNRPVIALAKNEEIVYTPEDEFNWKNEPQLHLLQRIRDEAHRFAVAYHKSLRDDIESALDEINGIGPERRNQLLRRFGSIDRIREATKEELTEIEGIGPSTAEAIQMKI
ncbi:MAG: excinuclease ABC subunit C [Halobacteriaceae archaeon]